MDDPHADQDVALHVVRPKRSSCPRWAQCVPVARRFEDANVLAVDRRRPDLPRVTLARGQEELPARQHTSARGMANRRLGDNTSWMDATDGCKPSSMKVRSTGCSESFPSTK